MNCRFSVVAFPTFGEKRERRKREKDPIGEDRWDPVAAEEGFEPSQTESESGVLPLHNSAKRKVIIMGHMFLVKCFLSDEERSVFYRRYRSLTRPG